MKNYKDLFLATCLLIVCVGLPQFTGVSMAPFLLALSGCFLLIWKLAKVQTEDDEREERVRREARGDDASI